MTGQKSIRRVSARDVGVERSYLAAEVARVRRLQRYISSFRSRLSVARNAPQRAFAAIILYYISDVRDDVTLARFCADVDELLVRAQAECLLPEADFARGYLGVDRAGEYFWVLCLRLKGVAWRDADQVVENLGLLWAHVVTGGDGRYFLQRDGVA